MTETEILELARKSRVPLGISQLDWRVERYEDKPYYYRFLFHLAAGHYTQNAIGFIDPLYVELGVWLGDSAAHFIAGRREQTASFSAYGVDHTFQMTKDMVDDKDFIFIKGDSRDPRVASLFQDKSIDVLFIDTHHKREVLSAELKLWLQKISAGGIVLCDDVCCPQIESASELFDELPFKKLKLPELHTGGFGFGVLFPPFDMGALR